MELTHVTYQGKALDDKETFNALPENLQKFLKQVNGLIAYDGGLHVRGCVKKPKWHSLHEVWKGAHSLSKNYKKIKEDDIPFAEDCVGDQFLLRGGKVIRLLSETGDIEKLNLTFNEFIKKIPKSPIKTLGLHPLLQFQKEGGKLKPGKLLNIYPPFCTKESANGVSIKDISAIERLDFLFHFSKQIS